MRWLGFESVQKMMSGALSDGCPTEESFLITIRYSFVRTLMISASYGRYVFPTVCRCSISPLHVTGVTLFSSWLQEFSSAPGDGKNG